MIFYVRVVIKELRLSCWLSNFSHFGLFSLRHLHYISFRSFIINEEDIKQHHLKCIFSCTVSPATNIELHAVHIFGLIREHSQVEHGS